MNIIKISELEVVNGLNIGFTIFVSGCKHKCKGCFNKDTWNKSAGTKFNNKLLQEIYQKVSLPYIKRVTFSGGDPLESYNIGQVIMLANSIKSFKKSIDLWVYTGYTIRELKEMYGDRILAFDYIVDGKYDINEKHTLCFRGSDNQVIYKKIDNDFVKWR